MADPEWLPGMVRSTVGLSVRQIRVAVRASEAVFVLLSRPLLRKLHSGSWVSFEIGLAANWRSPYLIPMIPQDRIDVYVFEPHAEPVDYAVPYCTYYMLYHGTVEQLKFLKKLIENAPQHNMGIPVKCPFNDCSIEFKLLTDVSEFKCPTCRRGISKSIYSPVG